MSNRRKSQQERRSSPRYGVKSLARKPLFKGANFDFEFMKGGPAKPDVKDRSLSGKDRVRARRAR